MNAKLYVILLLIFAPLAMMAQIKDQYLKATLTLVDGRKVNGFVKSLSDNTINDRVPVESSPGGARVTYPSDSIKRIDFDNGAVFQRVVFAASPEDTEATALGRLVVEGKLTVYHVGYRNVDYFVLMNPEGTFVLQKDKLVQDEVIHHYWRNSIIAATRDVPDLRGRGEKLSFSEQAIAGFVMDYNTALGQSAHRVKPSVENADFIIGFANVALDKKEPELFVQLAYRHFLPRVSHSLSLNAGLNYYDYRHYGNTTASLQSRNITSERISGQLYTAPVYLQQNLLKGWIRPYLFAGMNLLVYHYKDQYGVDVQEKGLQNNYGVAYLVGGGIEVNVTKNIMIKSEYRFELIHHPLFVGVGFCLPR